MKNILKFYREDELESRWWHRLVKVLIYGSTAIIVGTSVIFFVNNISNWNNPDPKYIYSFEPKYHETFGFSKSCNFASGNSDNYLSINCGYVSNNINNGIYFLPDFLDRYAKSISYKEEFLTKIPLNDCDKIGSPGLCRFLYLKVNYKLLNERIEQGQFDNIQAKRIIVMGPLIKNTLLVFIVPILWFFLLKSVIYRALIYIILGRKQKADRDL